MLPSPATVCVCVRAYGIWFRASEMRPLAPSKDAQASRRRKGKKAESHAPRQARATPARPPSRARGSCTWLARAAASAAFPESARGHRRLFPLQLKAAPAHLLPSLCRGRARLLGASAVTSPPRCLVSLPVRAGGASQAAAMETGARPWVVGGCCRARLGGGSSSSGGPFSRAAPALEPASSGNGGRSRRSEPGILLACLR